MMNKLLLASAALLLLPSCAASYPTLRGVYGPSFGGPVLADVSVNFGAATLAGKGGVSLASQDQNGYGFAFNGLDMWNGNVAHAPVQWTITDTTANAGYTPGTHFELDGTTSCKATITVVSPTPPTPRPCAAGVTAGLNKGPYTFSVVAQDAGGAQSAAHTLTYNIVANQANIGDQATDASGFAPTGWTAAAPSGAKLALSTGANWIASGARFVIKNLDYSLTNPVTFVYADAARPGGLWGVEVNNDHNMVFQGITTTGPQNYSTGAAWYVSGGASNLTFQDDAAIYDPSRITISSSMKGINVYGGSSITINNFVGRYLSSSCLEVLSTYVAPSHDVTFNNSHCRYVYDNFIVIGGDNVTLNDTYLLAPMKVGTFHIDDFQIPDGASPQNLTVNRLFSAMADGVTSSQGPMFSGTSTVAVGYIDDGAGHAGTKMHILSGVTKSFSTNNAGSPLVSSTDGLGVSVTPGTKLVTGCSTGGTCTVDITQLVGSAASPVTLYTAPMHNFQVNGVSYAGSTLTGFTFIGQSGTSFYKNFTFVKNNGYNNGADASSVLATGTITQYTSGSTYNIMTATAIDPSSAPYGIQHSSTDIHVYYPSFVGNRCNAIATTNFPQTCTSPAGLIVAASALSGTQPPGLALTGAGGIGTYSLGISPTTGAVTSTGLQITDSSVTSAGGPLTNFFTVDVPILHTGTMQLSSGFLWDRVGYFNVNSSPGSAPSNLSVVNVTQGLVTTNGFAYTHGVALADFLNGDPQVNMAAVTRATWAAMTDAQVVTAVVNYLKPKTGGDLDAGGGSWYGAFTQAGLWNDGSGKTPG